MAFEYPDVYELKDLDLKDEMSGNTNWNRLKEWELEWLQKLRAAVAQGTAQTVLAHTKTTPHRLLT